MIQIYRPISVLSSFSKIMEMCVFNNIYSIIILDVSCHQYGFLPGWSTSTNLASFNNFIYKALANEKQVDVIYTDFSKAFDKIHLVLLIKKLVSLRLFGKSIMLMTSNLINRKSFVLDCGYHSVPCEQLSRVFKGSHLDRCCYLST